MNADHASQKLLEWLDDPEVPYRVRPEIARDVLDRAGLAAAQVHKIVPMDADPVLAFFDGLFSDPNNWMENPTQQAIEEPATDTDVEPEESVEAEIAEPERDPANDTPPRIAEMIKNRAFDRKPGE